MREELRLFYVALTRAKYSLHLVGTAAPEERDIRRADRYLAFLPPDLPVAAEETGAAGRGKEQTKVFVGEGDERLCELIGKNLAYAYPFEADTRLKLKTSGYRRGGKGRGRADELSFARRRDHDGTGHRYA